MTNRSMSPEDYWKGVRGGEIMARVDHELERLEATLPKHECSGDDCPEGWQHTSTSVSYALARELVSRSLACEANAAAKGVIEAAAECGLPVGWTWEWPTEPGKYLFYGMRRGDQSERRLRLRLVTVALDSAGKPARFAESEVFYRDEQLGLFKRVSEELPSEAVILRLATPGVAR